MSQEGDPRETKLQEANPREGELTDAVVDSYVLAVAFLVRMSPWKVTVNHDRKIVQMITPKGIVSWSFHERHTYLFESLPVDTNTMTERVETTNGRAYSVIETMDRLNRQLHSTR